MLVTKDVYAVEASRGSWVYALSLDDGITLIDSSLPGRAERIGDELVSHELGDVVRILLTHHDVDHIGSVARLQERFGCEVFISATDLPYVQGARKREGIKRVIGAVMRVAAPKNLQELPTGAIDGIEILPTPGHTPGHTCFLFNRVLFAGDLLNSRGGAIHQSPALLTWNSGQLKASIASLEKLSFDWVAPGHGDPVQTSHIELRA